MADTATEAASAQSGGLNLGLAALEAQLAPVPAQQAGVVDCTEEDPDVEGDIPSEPELASESDEEG